VIPPSWFKARQGIRPGLPRSATPPGQLPLGAIGPVHRPCPLPCRWPVIFRLSASTGLRESITAYAPATGFSQLVWPSGRSLRAPDDRRPLRRDPVPFASWGLPWCPLVWGVSLLAATCRRVAAELLAPAVSRGLPPGCVQPALPGQAMSVVGDQYALALGTAPFLGGWIARRGSWRAPTLFLLTVCGFTRARLPGPGAGRNLPPREPPCPTTAASGLRCGAALTTAACSGIGASCWPALIVHARWRVAGYRRRQSFDFEHSFGTSPAQFGKPFPFFKRGYLVGSAPCAPHVVRSGSAAVLLWIASGAITAGALVMLAAGLGGAVDRLSLLGPMFGGGWAGGASWFPIGLAHADAGFALPAGPGLSPHRFLAAGGTAALCGPCRLACRTPPRLPLALPCSPLP